MSLCFTDFFATYQKRKRFLQAKLTIMNKILIIVLFVMFILSCNEHKEQKNLSEFVIKTDSLTIDLENIYKRNQLAGFAVSIFDKDSILYKRGFGLANKIEKNPYTTKSIQLIASISKTFIGVSLMKAIELGLMDLDDDVNKYLNFKVANPKFPDSTITLRHLATHTSSIGSPRAYNKTYLFKAFLNQNNWPEVWHEYVSEYNENKPVSLEFFLKNILLTDGEWYGDDRYLGVAPGIEYKYSNIGSSLLALAIENAVGKSYDDFIKEQVFEKLKMDNTSWDLQNMNENAHVTYYIENGNQIPNYEIITYPDGGILSTVEDLTKYCQDLIKCSKGEGVLLKKDSFYKMTEAQFKDHDFPDAICWDLSFSPLIGHAGNDFGSSTLMYFNPENGIGQILFSNNSIGNEKLDEAFYEIFNLLFKYDLKK